MKRSLVQIGFVLAGVLLLAGSLGLSTSKTSAQGEAEIQATVQAIQNAWNSKDAFTFREFWTDQGFEAEFGFSRSDVQQLAQIIGDPPITLTADNIMVEAGASADIALDSEDFNEREHWTFVFTGGRWLVDSSTTIAPEIPEGSTVVDVQLDEYAFTFDPSSIQAGDSVAFALENVGQEMHEFVLFRVTSGASVIDLLFTIEDDDEAEPEGLEFLAYAEAEPGASNVALLDSPFSEGRYAIVCFLPSPDGTPHAVLGMISEFNIGAGGGASAISPPNTGDGGLLTGSTGGLEYVGLALGGLALIVGLGGIVRSHAG